MFIDAAYVLFIQEFRVEGETLLQARLKAHDAFLSPEELRRKQNAQALKQLGAR